MSLLGDYKMSKMLTLSEEGEKRFEDVAVVLERMKESGEDPREISQMYMQMNTILTVTEKEMIYQMPIPEGMPEDEIEKARKAGMLENDMIVFDRSVCKLEDGVLYMYDRSTFLAGTEWVKISTDTEGELNLIMAIWEKID